MLLMGMQVLILAMVFRRRLEVAWMTFSTIDTVRRECALLARVARCVADERGCNDQAD